MKKICLLLCLLLSFSLLIGCHKKNPDETDDPSQTDENPNNDGLRLSAGEITIGVGETKQLSAINSETAQETSYVIWLSDNTSVVTVDFEGRLTGIADGTAVITASTPDGDMKATCTVTVTSVLSGINIVPAELSVAIGESKELAIAFVPETYAGAVVTWVSADESVATIKDGILTGVANGNTTIMANAEGFSAVCTVTVFTPVSSISLSEELVPLEKGKSMKLTATVLPENASDRSVKWTSSNPTSVKVSDSGEITALAGGQATITAATSNGKKAECTVVVNVPVTGISLSSTNLTLDPGETQKLTASVAPADANMQDVIWTSSNPAVATVGTNGEVKALKAGTTTITVTTLEGYFTANCAVTVVNSVTGLSFESDKGDLLIGQSLTLVPKKTPENADTPAYTWTSADPAIASVNDQGKVTAIKEGKTTITVTTPKGISAKFTINCIDPASINVAITKIEIMPGKLIKTIWVTAAETFTVSYSITPSNATEKVVIKSTDSSVVRVNSDGTLTAIKKGNATVTVSSPDGKISDKCTVTVSAMSDPDRKELEAKYDAELREIEDAHKKKLTEISEKYDPDIELQKTVMENASSHDTAEYKTAEKNLKELESKKEKELSDENKSYEKKLSDLKEKYPYLF